MGLKVLRESHTFASTCKSGALVQKCKKSDSRHAVALLRRALPRGTGIEPGQARDHWQTVQITVPDGPRTLLWLTTLRPELEQRPANATPVLVLRTRNSRQRDQLRRKRQSFIDLAGAAYIEAPGFYLDRTDLPPVRIPDSTSKGADPYADKASLVVRKLLSTSRNRRWSTGDLANAAEVDTSTASRVLRELRRRELVRDERPGQGRRSCIWVPDPEALLDDWARSYSWEDNPHIRSAAPVGSPRSFISRMKKFFAGERWALTLQAGASLLAPHAKFDVIHVYLDARDSLEDFAFERGWEVTSAGKLILMTPSYSQSAWLHAQTVRGVPVVSTVQLVLDLWHYPVRGREQASHLVEAVLRPIWESENESS